MIELQRGRGKIKTKIENRRMSTNKGKSICVGAKGVVLSELLKHSQQRKGLVWLGRK